MLAHADVGDEHRTRSRFRASNPTGKAGRLSSSVAKLFFRDPDLSHHFVDALSPSEKYWVVARRIGAVAATVRTGLRTSDRISAPSRGMMVGRVQENEAGTQGTLSAPFRGPLSGV